MVHLEMQGPLNSKTVKIVVITRKEFILEVCIYRDWMTYSDVSRYSNFPVLETFEVREIGNICKMVEDIISIYQKTNISGEFCVRILLPRGKTTDLSSRKMGLIIQGELLLSLRRKNLRPDIREVRYIHSQNHYGWLLLNPKVYDDQLLEPKEQKEKR
jgi:hypothetical protein